MYGFGEPLTKENILKRITSYDIFKYYSDNFIEVGKTFKGDLPGRDDQVPSAIVDMIGGDLMYSDFGYKTGLRCFDYVMEKLGLSYFDTLQQINNDFNLGLGIYGDIQPRTGKTIPCVSSPSKVQFEEKHPAIIQIKRREWNSTDKEYWYDKYYLSSRILNLFGVIPISHFWINGKKFIAEKHAYCYNFYWKEDGSIFYRKIYQPYSKKFKWVSNGGKSVQGEGMLPYKGDLLIITKSLKDVMVLYNLGFTSVAPTSESSFLPSQYYLKQGERFSRIVLFFDSDETGLKKAQEFSEKFGIEYRYIPLEYGTKDISDFIEKKGVEGTKQLLKKLF